MLIITTFLVAAVQVDLLFSLKTNTKNRGYQPGTYKDQNVLTKSEALAFSNDCDTARLTQQLTKGANIQVLDEIIYAYTENQPLYDAINTMILNIKQKASK